MIIAGLSSVPSRAVTHHAVLCKSPENGMLRLGFGRVSVRTAHSNRFCPRREAIEHRKNRPDGRLARAHAPVIVSMIPSPTHTIATPFMEAYP
jgi:hypothetical protein